MTALPAYMTERGADVELAVKAVPGAKRDAIVGILGDRLKIRVAAPPQDGKANDAIVRVLSQALAVPSRDIELISGPSNPRKVFRLRNAAIRAEELATALSAHEG